MQETPSKALVVVFLIIAIGSAYITATKLIEFSRASHTFVLPTPFVQAAGAAGVARWGTFYGNHFSFKYPPEWEAEEVGSAIFLFPTTYRFGCLDGANPGESSSCVYLKIIPKSFGIAYGIASGEVIAPDKLGRKDIGENPFSFIDQKSEGVRIADYFLWNSHTFSYAQFRYGERYVEGPGMAVPVSLFQTAEKIISTFTFVFPTDSPTPFVHEAQGTSTP